MKALGLREQLKSGVYPSHDVDAGLRAAFADQRAQERLRVAGRLLATHPHLLGAVVKEGKVTNGVRLLIDAALLVADHTLTANSLFRRAEGAGRPETCEACECGE